MSAPGCRARDICRSVFRDANNIFIMIVTNNAGGGGPPVCRPGRDVAAGAVCARAVGVTRPRARRILFRPSRRRAMRLRCSAALTIIIGYDNVDRVPGAVRLPPVSPYITHVRPYGKQYRAIKIKHKKKIKKNTARTYLNRKKKKIKGARPVSVSANAIRRPSDTLLLFARMCRIRKKR